MSLYEKNAGSVKVCVECSPDQLGEDTPRQLRFDDRRVEVIDIIDRWLAPDHRYFKLKGRDAATYILHHDVASGTWELVLFERGGPPQPE